MGAAQTAPNSIIKIKKHVRCPGNRKMLKSFHKLPNNVVKMTNEFRTSRICARCFTPFPLSTLSDRFKVCEWCMPDQDDWPDGLKLPRKIVTKKSKRVYQAERQAMREAMIENPNQADGFVPKVISYRKYWQQNAVFEMEDFVVQRPGNIHEDMDFTADDIPEDMFDQPMPILKTIWNRDISAAKLILYRGKLYLELKLK